MKQMHFGALSVWCAGL